VRSEQQDKALSTIWASRIRPSQVLGTGILRLPGWSSLPRGNGVIPDSTVVVLNSIPLDAPMVTLHGTNDPTGHPAIQGDYSLFLQGGSIIVGHQNGGASVFQTGQIPDTAKSLIYLGTESIGVSFSGHSLSPIALESTASYTEWGVDISPYAGQTGELRFAVPWQGASILDRFQFSPNPIPEPSVLSLGFLGFGFVVAVAQRGRRLR
jgi:hypothetical protein